jgi:hypothetical protein
MIIFSGTLKSKPLFSNLFPMSLIYHIMCSFQLAHNEGRGLVVKSGYVTNGSYYHHTGIKTPVAAISKIKTIRKQVFERTAGYGYPIPYVIVQPCMLNRLEKKIVCVNGLYHYTTHPPCSGELGHEYRYEGFRFSLHLLLKFSF